MKLISMLTHPGAGGPPRASLVGSGQARTRADAVAAAGRMVACLQQHGLRRGHRVLAIVDHDVDGVLFLAAASALGLRLLMPYNLQDGALPEWLNLVEAAGPDFVVDLKRGGTYGAALRRAGARVVELSSSDRDVAGRADGSVLIDAADPIDNFLVLFTSGTTGQPKAISISERLVCQRIRSVSRQLKFDAGSRVFMSGLLNNTTGLIFSFGALLHDATLIFPANRDIGDWPAQVAQSGATHIMLRPVAMKCFVEAAQAVPANLESLRVVAYGAAAMPRTVLEQGRRLMPCDWVLGYGLSETYGPFCWLTEADHRDDAHRRHVYCVGRPDDTLEVALRPHAGADGGIGEVVVRGEGVMEGYCDVRSGIVTPPDEWLPTGDLGEFTDDGYLLLKGRIHNTVMSANGHRIYPEEVEAVLCDVPGVAEAVLLGVAGRDPLIARPVACIHGALAGCDRAHIRDVVAAALSRCLGREKWPDWIFASKTPFPKSGNDKTLKAEVARLIDADALIEV